MNYRILVVDGMGLGVHHLTSLPTWEESGFSVTGRTADPYSAVSAAESREFDALVCIHRPDGKTAVEVLERLQRKAPDVPVLVISLTDDSACMRKCFLYGVVDFLIEPLGDEELRAALARMTKLLDRKVMNEEYAQTLEMSLGSLQQTGTPEPILDKLRELMETMQDSNVTSETAAGFFGFNPDYFTLYFKRKTGMTFSEYHKGFMIEYAKLLLSGGHFKVQEVSDILGFSSADYFTRIFKKRTGKTPSEFKKL